MATKFLEMTDIYDRNKEQKVIANKVIATKSIRPGVDVLDILGITNPFRQRGSQEKIKSLNKASLQNLL